MNFVAQKKLRANPWREKRGYREANSTGCVIPPGLLKVVRVDFNDLTDAPSVAEKGDGTSAVVVGKKNGAGGTVLHIATWHIKGKRSICGRVRFIVVGGEVARAADCLKLLLPAEAEFIQQIVC